MAELKEIAKCSACEASVIWATTSTGKWMMVDATPTPHGNVLLFPSAHPGRLVALVVGKVEGPAAERERYTAHFATCRFAGYFRQKKGWRR